MQRLIDFLSAIQSNNNKTWFDAHKSEYKAVEAYHKDFTQELITKLNEIDPTLSGLQVKDCTYRIYRDIRFSPDKTPYKQHIGTYIAPKGKKSGFAGYYVHIEPTVKNFLCTGLWLPNTQSRKSVLEEIMLNGKEFDRTIKKAKGFELDFSDSLKRIPAGFDKNDEFADYYRLKSFLVIKEIDNDYLLSSNVVEKIANDFAPTCEFCTLLNKAVEFAMEVED